jgi:enoyl-CoA hydratase/carnithine racemase
VTVSRSKRGHVTVVTLERPEALNAISGAMADELAGTLRDIGREHETWVVLLRAAGDKAFCVGADLKERAGFSLADYHANRRQVRGMFEALRAVPQPTIAAVFGYVLGGGLELALSCDLVVAADDSRMGLPEARVGLIPAGGGTQLLPRRVGAARAKELVFTGRQVEAREAADMGLVNRVVERAVLDDEAMGLARALCESSPTALSGAKAAIDSALGSSLAEGIAAEHGAWSIVVASEDRAEGIAAFNEKRAPRWSNK